MIKTIVTNFLPGSGKCVSELMSEETMENL